MRRTRILLPLLPWLAVVLLSARPGASEEAAPAWAAPPLENAVSVRDTRSGELVALDAMLDRLATADVVFFGETHTDETTHRLELAVYEGLLQRKPGQVVLALEMFERDVQQVLDDYVAGRIDEQQFLAQSRPWQNYATAYRPLIELARRRQAVVIASNFPRPLLAQVSMQGADALKNLKPEQAGHVPREVHPNTTEYWRRVDNTTRAHQGMMRDSGAAPEARLYSTQSLWDNAMGEACADALDKYPHCTVLHINGGFHSAYHDGTVHQLKLRKPTASVLTVSAAPASNPASAQLASPPVADYVAFVEAIATDRDEGMYSVYGLQQIKYRLHVPTHATPEQRVPLLIFLVDDGLTADDGLDLWKERLGDEAALAVLEAPYRETQADFSVGGRWFWPDSFAGDVSGVAGAVELIWAYVLRYFPVDPARVCVAGEGTGATVAASTALLTNHMELTAIAVAPRQYAKVKDFPLPDPAEGATPARRRDLRVIGDEATATWWADELNQYQQAHINGQTIARASDPWELDRQEEQAIREALRMEALPAPQDAPRRFILVPHDLPRARQWARLHALRLTERGDQRVAAVDQPPNMPDATPIATTLEAEQFAAEGTLPRCPGPFGGTTVVVLPSDTNAARLTSWRAMEENNPFGKNSRFYRVRIALSEGEGNLHDVLVKLQSENRKNILVVPAVFYADPHWIEALRSSVRDLENQMTLQWLPGLGGQPLLLGGESSAGGSLPVKHVLHVTLAPDSHHIHVRDNVQLPASLREAGAEFTLSNKLTISASEPAVERVADEAETGLTRYRLGSAPVDGLLTLEYEGAVDHGLSDEREQYTRGFRQTRGIVGKDGVYLDGDSGWVARFNDDLIRFTMDVRLPDQWHVISQGQGTSRDDEGIAHWDSQGLAECIYVVGGPLLRYQDAAGAVDALVYLRAQDDVLARKYLDATAQYLEMYRQLIGPYPYGKFALVENFWETGYGMPSFTLLGSQVIRFPFILHSSYPHEILHNWWGNSVLVDYDTGNWCEGLTAYLADHLVQEQRGLGHEYRRSTLQKYRDYVREGRDFPLIEFRQRHSAATEAVGYGKALMLYHMLRRQIGDDAFRAGLARLYQQRDERASFADVQRAFEEAASTDLRGFFEQWTTRTGAPVLRVENVECRKTESGFTVSGVIQQAQQSDPYTLQVPVTVLTAKGSHTSVVDSAAREQAFSVAVEALPTSLYLDPLYDLFRVLDPRETPASIGQIFGEPRIVAVLPAAADEARRAQYQALVQAWISDAHQIDVVLDSDLPGLPESRCVWILGRENRFAADLLEPSPGETVHIDGETLHLAADAVPLANHSFVVVRRHPEVADKAVGLIVVDPPAAFDGLARKLPHYGKYSYLAFEGSEPANTVKGQWSASGSPLIVDLRADRSSSLPPLEIEKRGALAELPPVFSADKLARHVDWLAAPEREGRGLGSNGLQQSAEYIARQFAEIGLQPGGDDGTWFQTLTVAQGPQGAPVPAVNVIGILRGNRAEWASESIVVGAHFDHLGFGWPDVRDAFRGQVHPGADDNASGVAVLLELARTLAAESDNGRNLVFAAFSAEECGRWGSRHYVEHPTFPAAGVRGMVNLDTVGRLGNGKIAVHACGTAREWQHVFLGCGYVTGIPNQIVMGGGEGSDQQSFIEQGIPAVQIFTGGHPDYHSPSDTPDKVDSAGLVKVATFVKEAVEYLTDTANPLSSQISGPASGAAPPPSGPVTGRPVSFGIMPDIGYAGPGAKAAAITPDSPAAQAGLQPSDIILQLDDQPVADTKAFSNLLRTLKPDQTVTVQIQRGEERLTVKVVVVKR